MCDIEQPLQGTITVEHSAKPIKSVELQLVRVETCGCAEGYVVDQVVTSAGGGGGGGG